MTKIAGLFPGQGSQQVGMGQALYAESSQAKEIFDRADEVLGVALSKLCFEGPIEELTLTENAQPAILLVSYASYICAGIEPAVAAGHSLGEYTALVAAEALSFEDAITLVRKRGQYMQEAVKPGDGKMLAVLGPSVEEIEESIAAVDRGVAQIANLNCPGQTVIAGDVEGVDLFSAIMTEKGAKVKPLQVSAPFHCDLMKPAADRLGADLDAISFATPKFPVYSNVTAEAIADGDQARELLKQQVCSSVRWTESMQRIIAEQGITQVVEFGPGGVLSRLLKRIDNSVARAEAHDPASVEKVRDSLV